MTNANVTSILPLGLSQWTPLVEVEFPACNEVWDASCRFSFVHQHIVVWQQLCKVALLFKFMNMGMVNKNTFFTIQDTYCVDTIKDFWEERSTEALCRLQGKDVVVLQGSKLRPF